MCGNLTNIVRFVHLVFFMKLLIILTITIMAVPQAFTAYAWDVLVVQNYRAKPYSEVVRGFRTACPSRIDELILSELAPGNPLREIRRSRPDLILAIGIDALSIVRKIRDIPIIYCMVLNPESMLSDEGNITGVSMNLPPDKQLAVLRKAIPHLKKIGLIYSPAHTGPIAARAVTAAERMGISLVTLKAERPNDLPRQLERLPKDLDAYWMLPDSSLTSPEAVESLLLYSIRARVPIFTFSDKYLRMGAFVSLDLDTYELGRQTGEMAERVRGGVDVATIPRIDADRAIPTMNRAVASKLGIAPDNKILKKFRFVDLERP
jgi:putative tryptophan/tyrosine transport system substrate-binding protein